MSTTAPIKILVVDDEPDLESLIKIGFRKKIRQKEFEFQFAANGAEALEKIESDTQIDLLLCDIRMPIMDGLTLLTHLVPKQLTTKYVMVSAYGDLSNIRSAMNLGAFDFVVKPIEFNDLETTIQKAHKEVVRIKEALQTRHQLTQTTKNLDDAEEQTRKLRELDELKTRLFTQFSHEFRTPLTIIRGMADEMIEKPEKASPSGLKMVRRNTDHLLHLINQVLDLRKLEAGKLALQSTPGDLVFLARYICDSFQSLADDKEIELQFLAKEERLEVSFDEIKLLQVVSNLLSNAIKYTPIGGKVDFRLNWKKEGEVARVLMEVKDTGIGIEANKLPHIFEEFYQAHEGQETQGTGVGLALTQELVGLMEGKISVESTPEKGTVFSVRMPLAFADVTSSEPSINSFFNSYTSPSGVPLTQQVESDLPNLLIVEDNADIRQYLSICLEGRYNIQVARDGNEGIQKALEEIPDIIISDVMMPHKNGFEVCEYLKSEERTSHIPVILLTAKTDVDSKLKGLGLGADVYLSKPFHKEELLAHLENLVTLRSKLQARYQLEQSPDPSDNPITQRQDEFILKFQQILTNRLDDSEFRIPELCQEIGMSRTSLHRKVKALTGLSTTRFILDIRMQRADTLLRETKLGIAEIAYSTGFSTSDYFSKSYKAKYGVSPRERRKM